MSEPQYVPDITAKYPDELAARDAYYNRLRDVLAEVAARLGTGEADEDCPSVIRVTVNEEASPGYDLVRIFEAVLKQIPPDNIRDHPEAIPETEEGQA